MTDPDNNMAQGIAEALADAAKKQYEELRQARIDKDYGGSEKAYQAYLDASIPKNCADKWTHEYFWLIARDKAENPPEEVTLDHDLEQLG